MTDGLRWPRCTGAPETRHVAPPPTRRSTGRSVKFSSDRQIDRATKGTTTGVTGTSSLRPRSPPSPSRNPILPNEAKKENRSSAKRSDRFFSHSLPSKPLTHASHPPLPIRKPTCRHRPTPPA